MGVPKVYVLYFLCILFFSSSLIFAEPFSGSGLTALNLLNDSPIVFNETISQLLSANVTFEAWISLNNFDNLVKRSIVSRTRNVGEVSPDFPLTDTDKFSDFNFGVSAGGILFFFMGAAREGDPARIYGIDIAATTPLSSTGYTHVAFSFWTRFGETSPAEAAIYVNGQRVGYSVWRGGDRQNLAQTHPIRVGQYSNPDNFWLDGRIDEIRLWNKYRTAVDIQEDLYKVLKGNEKGLVGYFRLNEGTASIVSAENSILTSNVIGTPQWVNSGVSGLPLSTHYGFQGASIPITLLGVDTESPLLECVDCNFEISELPSNGILSSDAEGNNVLSEGDNVTNPDIFFRSNVFVPLNGLEDSFVYNVYPSNGKRGATVPLFIIATGQCGPIGSGFELDDCGLCEGTGSTCLCEPGDEPTYRGYNRTELDQLVLLYEIDLTLVGLGELDAGINGIFEILAQLDLSQPSEVLCSLPDIIEGIRNWNRDCLEQYEQTVSKLIDILS